MAHQKLPVYFLYVISPEMLKVKNFMSSFSKAFFTSSSFYKKGVWFWASTKIRGKRWKGEWTFFSFFHILTFQKCNSYQRINQTHLLSPKRTESVTQPKIQAKKKNLLIYLWFDQNLLSAWKQFLLHTSKQCYN
jgi:hypothetical protein